MKRRILLTITAVCTVFSIVGGYVFFTSQQTTTSENKSAVSKKKPPTTKNEKPKQPPNKLTLGKNKENSHLEKNFGGKQLQVEGIDDRAFQSSLKKRTEIKMKPEKAPPKKQDIKPVKPIPSKPEKEEDSSSPIYEKARVMKPINNQLDKLDLAVLEAKEPLIIGADVTKLQQLIATKQLSYKELAGIYLNRIKKYDQNGQTLNAITEINPTIIAEAEQLDKDNSANKSALYGMPVLFKR